MQAAANRSTVRDGIPFRQIVGAIGARAAPMILFVDFMAPIHLTALVGNTVLYVLASIACTVWHEGGHASMARVLRFDVPFVTIGRGREAASFRIGNTLIIVRMLPVGGLTYWVPRTRRSIPLRAWMVVAAGPLSSALVCAAVWPLVDHAWSGGVTQVLGARIDFPLVVFIANAVSTAWNLIPYWTQHGGRSDGLQLLTLPFRGEAVFVGAAALPYVLRAEEAIGKRRYDDAFRLLDEGLARFPDALALLHARARVSLAMGRYVEARRELERLYDHAEAKGPFRAFLRNNIAWAVLMSAQRDRDLDYADALSADAMSRLRQVAAICGTRGAVLAYKGEVPRAIALLQKAIDLNPSRASRAHNAAWLALAHARAGAPQRSGEYLALCRELDPGCGSLPVIEEMLRQTRVSDDVG